MLVPFGSTQGASQPCLADARGDAPCHALHPRVGDEGKENQAYDLAWARWAGPMMVLGIMAAPNKAMKQTSACPSFARAPGAGGALALAAYRQCSADSSDVDATREASGPPLSAKLPGNQKVPVQQCLDDYLR